MLNPEHLREATERRFQRMLENNSARAINRPDLCKHLYCLPEDLAIHPVYRANPHLLDRPNKKTKKGKQNNT